eukprot:CAMPEP_0168620034 /NCGR_PEP_ID=MMETSP0449_2-20121227/6919_1 /TAXON_ID=1082188 /ORGANISM="Strombidium rassoulzadegani, Strain ras09" /LENGTH=80 /DNA_ID=CAMNT_0008661007 /DNA_START=30 /DNA_END=269 /DNA_ORIENTATION=-
MTLHRANVPFENVFYTIEQVQEARESGKLFFGQVPVLELDDGSKMEQTTAIVNFLGQKYGLRPSDPTDVYFGEKCVEYYW